MAVAKTTERSRVRQARDRGSYDRAAAYAILDEALVCHAGFSSHGQPFVIPMLHARAGDRLLLHGAVASRFQQRMSEGIELCVTVTLLDGLVLARSTFHHSANYRSVMVFGVARAITEDLEKSRALGRLVEQIVPGRSAQARGGNRKELNATGVIELPIEEFSIKCRTGMPADNAGDLGLPVWAGVLPLHLAVGAPQADAYTPSDMPVPDYITEYRRRVR